MNEGPPTDLAPEHVRQLAEDCRRSVAQATGVELDFTPETLPLLDHFLSVAPREGDSVRGLLAPAAGAYFGELVRARFPCRWHAPVDDYGAWRIEFETVFLHFNPVALAHEALMSREVVDGGAGFGVLDDDLEAVRAGLEALGTINEDDYFKLSTRFEVLTTVVDRLTGRGLAEGTATPRFDADAYRAVLGDDTGQGVGKPS